MSISEMRDLIVMSSALLSIGGIIYTWLTVRSKVNTAQIELLLKRVEDSEKKVAVLEAEMRQLPSATTIHKLELTMERLQGEMEVLSERMKPIGAVGDRIQEFLMSKAFSS